MTAVIRKGPGSRVLGGTKSRPMSVVLPPSLVHPQSGNVHALVRPALRGTTPPLAAQDSESKAIRLDLNEALFQLTPEMKARMGQVAAEVALTGYPDGACTALRKAAAGFFGVRHMDCMTVGNGADDLIGALCGAFGQPRMGRSSARVLVPELSFEAYRMAAAAYGLQVDSFSFEHNFEPDLVALESAIGRTRPNLVFLATPNNPTGTTLDPEALKGVMVRNPDVMFVLDEAYVAYSNQMSLADMVVDFPNAVCLSSLSKLGLAGLRLGFASAHPAVIRTLNNARMPFPVNALSQAVGAMLLDEFAEDLLQAAADAVKEREHVLQGLTELQNSSGAFRVLPSQANFHLIVSDQAAALHAALASKGVVVRRFNAPHPHHPLSSILRISVGHAQENQQMLAAFAASVTHP